jgi:hypothetical protein
MSDTPDPAKAGDDPVPPAVDPAAADAASDTQAVAHADAVDISTEAEAPLDVPDTSSTKFIFKNRAFLFPDCYFELHPGDKQPAFFMSMNDIKLSILLSRLTTDFGLDPKSNDAHMLGMVSAGLNFVRRIHPGDDIPNELLDGSASWSVSEQNTIFGRGRVALVLGKYPHNPDSIDADYVQQLLGDPNTDKRLTAAIDELVTEAGKPDITRDSLREALAVAGREASYVEALLDSIKKIAHMRDEVIEMRSHFSRELVMQESIGRIVALFEKPMKQLNLIKANYLKLIASSPSLMISEGGIVAPIREIRDRLRFEVIRWEDTVAKWESRESNKREVLDPAIRRLYTFLARHFPVGEPWPLTFGTNKPKRSKRFRI